MKRMAFYFDADSCSGCKTCQIACKDKNDHETGMIWRRVYEINGGNWEQKNNAWKSNVFAYNLSISCNHCDNPVCMKACPAKAIEKREDGIVFINPDKCMGCRYCEWVCPYGAPRFDKDAGIMEKCDFCMDYIDRGLPPACVAACPMRALDYGDYDDLVEKYGDAKHIYPLPSKEYTEPMLIVKEHHHSKRAESEGAKVVNLEEVNNA